jgi:hypothetical protein
MVKKTWETEYRLSIPADPTRATTNYFWLDLDAEAALVAEYAQYCASRIVNTDDGDWLVDAGNTAKGIPKPITVTDRRNRLGGDILEALQYLRSWLHIRDQEADLFAGLYGKKSDEGQKARRDNVKNVEN